MKKKLIGDNIEPKCGYCKLSQPIQDVNIVLCSRIGITSSDGSCKKFIYDPLKRKPETPPELMQYTDKDFSLEFSFE